jgi:hypothetical protein
VGVDESVPAPAAASIHSPTSEQVAWSISVHEKALDRLLDSIRAADAKAATVLAIDAAMIAALVALAARSAGQGPWLAGWIATGSALLVTSVFLVALATVPQLMGPPESLIFFGGIASRTSAEYAAASVSRGQREYLGDLTSQCHRNAAIALSKYERIRYATLVLIIGVWPWLASIFFAIRG